MSTLDDDDGEVDIHFVSRRLLDTNEWRFWTEASKSGRPRAWKQKLEKLPQQRYI